MNYDDFQNGLLHARTELQDLITTLRESEQPRVLFPENAKTLQAIEKELDALCEAFPELDDRTLSPTPLLKATYDVLNALLNDRDVFNALEPDLRMGVSGAINKIYRYLQPDPPQPKPRYERPPTTPVKACASCRFSAYHQGFNGLHCRRYPPQVLLEPENAVQPAREIGLWPPVEPEHWCGEFQPKPSK